MTSLPHNFSQCTRPFLMDQDLSCSDRRMWHHLGYLHNLEILPLKWFQLDLFHFYHMDQGFDKDYQRHHMFCLKISANLTE